MRAEFNDKTDPTWEFENQCVCFKRVCSNCGTRFPKDGDHCISCGAIRPRCKNRAMAGEVICRAHASGRPYTIYNKLAGTLSDTLLEEVVESDDRDLSQEFALARIALSSVLDGEAIPSSKELLGMVKDFFSIAEKKKNIEQGQVLNIAWNDEMVNSLRQRVRKLIKTFEEILNIYIIDEELRKKILMELREKTRMPGNMITSPMHESDYIQEPKSNIE